MTQDVPKYICDYTHKIIQNQAMMEAPESERESYFSDVQATCIVKADIERHMM